MHRKREINLSTLAFIDVMACGLGAVILLFFVLDFEEPSQEKDSQKQVVTQADDSHVLSAEYQRLMTEKETKMASIEGIAKVVSDSVIDLLKINLQTVKTIEEPDRPALPMSSLNKPSQLIGLAVNGTKILIALDTSASMAHVKLVEIISSLGDASGQRLEKGLKWKRAKQVVRWLIEQSPPSSSIQIIGYSDRITFSDSSWNKPKEALGIYNSKIETISPKHGTSLAVALEYINSGSYQPSDIYLVTDGLPTLSGNNSPLFALNQMVRGCFKSKKSNTFVSGNCRRMLFQSAVGNFQKQSGARIHVILLPLEGDPEAAHLYQHWTNISGGTLLSPAASWLK
ncbi:MAG: hypothetical protein VX986_03470 [Pseudomonadota bacterium]|nr:hypothetical protein [Pseudomonadota bacterium]